MAKQWYKGRLLSDREYYEQLESETETNKILAGCFPFFAVLITLIGYLIYLFTDSISNGNPIAILIGGLVSLLVSSAITVFFIKKFPILLDIGLFIMICLILGIGLYIIYYLYDYHSVK